MVRDKQQIERYLRDDTPLHVYELGDLDDFFWPHTLWYGLDRGSHPAALVLLYTGMELPALMALTSGDQTSMEELLSEVIHLLPDRCYCHLTPGLEQVVQSVFRLESHGRHVKMTLTDPDQVNSEAVKNAERLGREDEVELVAFYRECYPDNWFDPRMLDTGKYFGLRRDSCIVSVAGIHVYSPAYRVAALGNITTWPALRGQGLARTVTASLCRDLLETVDCIGLNVKADNAPAIRCYERLGFTAIGDYEEFMALKKACL